MEEKGKVIEMTTGLNEEGLVEIDERETTKLEVSEPVVEGYRELGEGLMSEATKEWMDTKHFGNLELTMLEYPLKM